MFNMASINIDDEKRLIVSIKDISSLDTSIGENQTVTADTSDINYVPGYVEAEKQRRENETERISNEAERKAYYQEIQEKVNNGEFKGEKGDKGEPGPKGNDGAPGEPGTTDYNELQNKPTIPSKTSDLVNDSDFVNGSDLSTKQDKLIAGTNITIENNVISSTGGGGTTGTTDYSELINKPKINGTTLSGDKTLSELGIQEKGDYLESESDPIYTADKPNIALKTELFSKNYNDLTNKPIIPTKISQIENDKNYITGYTETDPLYTADKPSIALKSEIPNNDDFSLLGLSEKSYNNLTDKPIIPSKTSDLTNDNNFVSDSDYVHTDNNYTTEEKTKLSNILNLVYPIGSIYISINSTNPSTFLGGEWEQIKDVFLLACGDKYLGGTKGGEATHVLSIDEMPEHNHTQTPHQHNSLRYTAKKVAAGNGYMAVFTAESANGEYQGYTNKVTATNNATGGGLAHNNMPPYLAVYVWKRTA